jgi:mono/diheme cytochrome c family protein
MLASVEVVSREAFNAWLEQRTTDAGAAELGKETWEGVCAKCHGLAGEGGIARRIAGSPTLSNPQALETLVRNGRATRTGVMPAVGSGWTDAQIEALATYLKESPPSGVTG